MHKAPLSTITIPTSPFNELEVPPNLRGLKCFPDTFRTMMQLPIDELEAIANSNCQPKKELTEWKQKLKLVNNLNTTIEMCIGYRELIEKDIASSPQRDQCIEALNQCSSRLVEFAKYLQSNWQLHPAVAKFGEERAKTLEVLSSGNITDCTEFSKAKGISTASVTGILDRLEKYKYQEGSKNKTICLVERMYDKEDRRKIIPVITLDGELVLAQYQLKKALEGLLKLGKNLPVSNNPLD